MTTVNNQTATSFLTFVGREGIDNQNGLKRASRFDEVFSSYAINDSGIITVTKKDDSVVNYHPLELFGRFQTPDALPNGNGKIDSALDGKSGENTSKKATAEPVKYLQTSIEYLPTALANHADILAAWRVLESVKGNETKDKLVEAINAAKALLLPAEQLATYTSLLESEKDTEELKALGFVFGTNAVYLDAQKRKVYRGTIEQSIIAANGSKISELIEPIGQPIPKTEGDLFAGNLQTVYEIAFRLKSQEAEETK